MYSIGKLANISHVSIRTLRYYDEIGLLLPTYKNNAGHRFYISEDVSKLHYILTLKDLGFPLETIRQFLFNHEFDLQSVLRIRKKIIQEEQKNLKKVETSIETLLTILESGENTDWDSIFETLSTFSTDKSLIRELWAKYFSEEEQQVLNKFSEPGGNSEEEKSWEKLTSEVRANLNKDPSSPIAQELAKRWVELVDKTYEGNDELALKVWDLNKSREPHLRFFPFEQEIIIFIEKAIEHYFLQKESSR
ncbi:MerR family transcriptional regulator [Planococcus antarcticus DSM 14505]|uniref:MerR family transcriptional regulator n=1 Tax=Planococcus antarcticus DSM 14505 TaxID=1185653 RepID=A0AA87IPE9_9BACL|nr:MerR family transcriptional regulator [Planococcus antarcticus]EIM08425.1 MerR family transcriptional regulator [Planococcus antarcticus DSM 14505]